MSITTFAELKTSIASWSHRSDLTAIIPDCITFAENTMNYGSKDWDISPLRVASMETAFLGATVANTTEVALPDGFLEWRRLQITVDGQKSDLDQVSLTPIGFDEQDATPSVPDRYTIVGGNMEMRPIPNAVYALTGTYYLEIPALSDDNASNWLLAKAPNAYLYGSLLHLSIHMGGVGVQWRDTWLAGFRSSLNQLTRQDSRKRFSQLKRRTDLGVSTPSRRHA